MPRIQEYLPQENASEPVGGLSPNTELAGAAGEGLRRFGQGMMEGGDVLLNRHVQLEQTQAMQEAADMRQQSTDDIMQSVADGTVDADRVKQNLQQWQSDAADKYETPQGKNLFNRQSSRLIGAMVTKAARGQIVVSQNNAKSSFNDSLNALATTVRQDPDQLADAYGSVLDTITHATDSGLISAKDAPAIHDHAVAALAKEAILGRANTDPDKAETMLNDPTFTKVLPPQVQDELRKTVKAAQNQKDLDAERNDVIQKKANAAVMNQYLTNNLQALTTGKMNPKDILLNAPSAVDFDTRLAYAEKANRAQGLVDKTDPAALADVHERLLLPKDDPRAILDVSQLIHEPGIALADVNKISKWYLQTPQGAAEKQREKGMLQDIQSRLKVQGVPDPEYKTRIVNAMAEYQRAKQAAIDAGKDPTELTNPKSKEYFAGQVRAPSPVDLMKAEAARFTNPQTPAPEILHTTPGIIPPLERKDKSGNIWLYDATTKKPLGRKPMAAQ